MLTRRATALAVTLLVTAVLSSCTTGTTGPTDEPTPGASAVGPGSGDLLVHGVVRRDGEPHAGAEVVVSLWPEPDDTEVGEVVEMLDHRAGHDGVGRRLRSQSRPVDELPSRYFPVRSGLPEASTCRSWAMPRFVEWTQHRVAPRRPTSVWRSEGSRPGDAAIEMDVDLADGAVDPRATPRGRPRRTRRCSCPPAD